MVSLESCQDLPATTPPLRCTPCYENMSLASGHAGERMSPYPLSRRQAATATSCMTRSCLDAVLLARGMQLEGTRTRSAPPSSLSRPPITHVW